jgi:FkbM family methyltransferase
MIRAIRQAVRNTLASRLEFPSIQFSLERLKQNGFSPKSVFDVGAYQGDFAAMCLRQWPETEVTCFEVLPEPSARLLAFAANRKKIKLISCLLGARNQDRIEFNIADTASSVLVESARSQTNKASFNMRTIDDVVAKEYEGRGPDFLKMDVQGYELEVLKGATGTLRSIEVILAEINFLDLHDEVPLLAQFVSWMSERDWVAYDICGLTRRPLDRALWQADMIFVPENSPFRQSKSYE